MHFTERRLVGTVDTCNCISCSLLFIVSVRWLVTSNSHTVREMQVPMHKRSVFRHCSGDNAEIDYLMILMSPAAVKRS
jgi:hypothetical protein